MLCQALYFILVLSPVLSRNVPRFADLDEDDQHLYRAAYDTPSYDHDEYEYEEDGNKLDLVKDGLWAIKAKIKELKAFDKALAANMLATKIKVKDLLENHLGELKHHHHDKKKPSYSYQAPSYHQPQYPAPQYGGAGAQYPAPQYGHDPYYGH
ncbi:uncharacterized protein LOC114355492 isoform X2 [Ostrinia furnacalis]|uniref:uncharacterized protein LOC114355492 isoform X2 n=1 Tax=Ostrinia furnacalis TaxID=93504 RepID=UPI00103CF83F|nr:uncharacterized protein LOC114355492 isoform X2 [Ostrinia furnacalis]